MPDFLAGVAAKSTASLTKKGNHVCVEKIISLLDHEQTILENITENTTELLQKALISSIPLGDWVQNGYPTIEQSNIILKALTIVVSPLLDVLDRHDRNKLERGLLHFIVDVCNGMKQGYEHIYPSNFGLLKVILDSQFATDKLIYVICHLGLLRIVLNPPTPTNSKLDVASYKKAALVVDTIARYDINLCVNFPAGTFSLLQHPPHNECIEDYIESKRIGIPLFWDMVNTLYNLPILSLIDLLSPE